MPRAIERVVNADGAELPVPGDRCSRGISPEVAAATAFALQGVMHPGGTGSGGNPNDGTPMIGKTGTHELIQTWLVESSTRVTTAVWVGNAIGVGDMFRAAHNGRIAVDDPPPDGSRHPERGNQLYPGGSFAAPPAELLRRGPAPARSPDPNANP